MIDPRAVVVFYLCVGVLFGAGITYVVCQYQAGTRFWKLNNSLRKIHDIAARELSEPPDGGTGALVEICTEAEKYL